MTRNKFKFVTLNLLKAKHKDLIKWIVEQASDSEMSISSFCISVLKKYKRMIDNDKTDKVE